MKMTYLKQLLTALLLLCSTVVSAKTYSGTCGTSVNWSLDTETGVLNITGTGEMTNYSYVSSIVPWCNYLSKITNVTIGNSVTTIGGCAFYNCKGLTSVTIPNSVTSIGTGAFWGCTGLTSVTIPNSVTSIGSMAFRFCIGLTSVTIPNGVTSIGMYAFDGCSGLTSVTIGNSVTSIGIDAFYGCTGLTEIYSLAETPATISSYTFQKYSATLYVPIGTKAAYQAADYWKNFTNIVEMDFTGIEDIEADGGNAIHGMKDAYYDLNGRRVSEPVKGVYIRNGKKIYVE